MCVCMVCEVGVFVSVRSLWSVCLWCIVCMWCVCVCGGVVCVYVYLCYCVIVCSVCGLYGVGVCLWEV